MLSCVRAACPFYIAFAASSSRHAHMMSLLSTILKAINLVASTIEMTCTTARNNSESMRVIVAVHSPMADPKGLRGDSCGVG